MAVSAILILAALCAMVLYTLRRYIHLRTYNINKITETQCVKNETHSVKQLPGIPIWSLSLMWWRFTTFLQYIGTIDSICQIKYWKWRIAFINDYKLGKELYKNPIFCGKQVSEVFQSYSHGPYGILNSHGNKWKEQIRFCHNVLKDFGFGSKSMETIIQNEIDDVLESWRSTRGARFSPNKSFYLPVLNSLWVILTGERTGVQDKEIVPILHRVYQGFNKTCDFPTSLLIHSKISYESALRLHKWVPIFSGFVQFKQSVEDLRAQFQIKIETRKKSGKVRTGPSNLVDAYLQEIEQTTDPTSGFYGKTGNLNLLAIMTDFFIAGGDTTANEISWAMLHLIRNPGIQSKIREEIHSVVGLERRPSLQDKHKCPYTEAFLLEVLRFTPIASVAMPHATTEDTFLGPYFIEKETVLLLNIYNIHHDPKIWGDPQNFRPERFLSEDKTKVVRHEAMVAFSTGQRRCFGEQLARDSLFLFVATICQKFKLSPDPLLKEIPPLRGDGAGLYTPAKFYMVVTLWSDLEPKINLK